MKSSNDENKFDKEFKSMDKKVNFPENEQEEVLQYINNQVNKTSPKRVRKPMWNYYLALTAAAIIITILSIPIIDNFIHERTGDAGINQIMNEVGYKNILHQEEVDNGVVVFYIPDIESNDMDNEVSDLSSIFIKRNIFGVEETQDRGTFSTNLSDDLTNFTSQYLPKSDEHSPFPMVFGEINNPDITKIKIKDLKSDQVYEAEVISTDSHVLWYSFLNKNEREMYEVRGLSEEGEVIASNVVNEYDEDGAGIEEADD